MPDAAALSKRIRAEKDPAKKAKLRAEYRVAYASKKPKESPAEPVLPRKDFLPQPEAEGAVVPAQVAAPPLSTGAPAMAAPPLSAGAAQAAEIWKLLLAKHPGQIADHIGTQAYLDLEAGRKSPIEFMYGRAGLQALYQKLYPQ